MNAFSSRDFWRVGAELRPDLPERLHHPAVRGSRSQGAASFSAERGHGVDIVDLPSITLSMTIGSLAPGEATRRHRHNYETMIYIVAGRGTTTIEDREIEWQAGDALHIPVWALHGHRSRSTDEECVYIACENAPLLQNLGGIALRHEENRS